MTVNIFDDPQLPLELGGSVFVEANRILLSTAKKLALPISGADQRRPMEASDTLGVWNGEKFVFTQSEGSYFIWNLAKLLWKYGLAPVRAQRLMKSSFNKFLRMYEEPHFPFKSLSETAGTLGLTALTSTPGSALFKANNIAGPFATDIIQASTRVNYAQNLEQIHGLESLVCLAAEGAMSVEGGNWRIFDGMLRESGAQIRLNTSATSITKQWDNSYMITTTGTDATGISSESEAHYDDVILAAPFQMTGLKVSGPSRLPEEIPYVHLHVTLLTSKHRLSPAYFKLPETRSVPEIVLTTLPTTREPQVPFFSLSTLRTINNTSTIPPRKEYAYKIFSHAPVTPDLLARLFGFSTSADEIALISKEDISWSHIKMWQSYPYLHPRVTFEDLYLDENFLYTSGIESFISTMETSALMGKNAAKLITEKWSGSLREMTTKFELK